MGNAGLGPGERQRLISGQKIQIHRLLEEGSVGQT